jgi:hypothetical protein
MSAVYPVLPELPSIDMTHLEDSLDVYLVRVGQADEFGVGLAVL